VLVENCTFTGTAHSARIKSQPSRGGVIEDIVFRDIKLENPGEAFDFEMAWDLRLERAKPADPLTACRDIKLINFSGQARSLGTITGIPGGEIRDVTMENCNITATRGLRVRDAAEIHTEGLHAKVSQGPVIVTGQRAATQPFNLPT
jgi:polygalacturonase